jgi:hypothetical protein
VEDSLLLPGLPIRGLFNEQQGAHPSPPSSLPPQVLGVSSQDDMLLQQAAARALAIPTHTFAERLNRQRNLMAIGPAPAEQLEQIMLHLQELS